MEIVTKLADWFGFGTPRCRVCEATLDKDHGEIVFMSSDHHDFQTMKICSSCIDALEKGNVKTREEIEDWKKHESL